MSNYYDCDLYINGESEEAVNAVLRFIGADRVPPRFDFLKVVPLDNDSKEAALDGWGCLSDARDIERRDRGGIPCVSFQTNGFPPVLLIQALHRKFPDTTLILEYFNGGADTTCGGFALEGEYEGTFEGDVFEPGVMVCEWRNTDYLGRRGG